MPVAHEEVAAPRRASLTRVRITRESDPLRIKPTLIKVIAKQLGATRFSKADAARCLGVSERKLSNMLYGRVERVTEGQLLEALATLGFDVELKIERRVDWRPGDNQRGRVAVSLQEPPDDDSRESGGTNVARDTAEQPRA